ncbi:hypothetical protein [Sphingobium sp.]|uniref:hypothetical protein n=1 Tax=Sphingobium sp. TaxID=1912891 RepID=UPI0025DF5795|nr:hypothetical protein [Sphingobium sp.]
MTKCLDVELAGRGFVETRIAVNDLGQRAADIASRSSHVCYGRGAASSGDKIRTV